MGSSKVVINDKPFRDIVSRVKRLEGKRVVVGVFDGEQALIAVCMEYGVPSKNIPSRPFLRSTFLLRRKDIIAFQHRMVRLVLQGNIDEITALSMIGEYVVSLIKETIVVYGKRIFEPLKPKTIKAKGGKTTPLINTGSLLNSITWKIVDA